MVQQRAGAVPVGLGGTNTVFEHHADRVADAVVKGESAQGLLDEVAVGGAGSRGVGAIQRRPSRKGKVDWSTKSWDQLTAEQRCHWRALGWGAFEWATQDAPASESKTFKELDKREQQAATALGYAASTWDSAAPVQPLPDSQVATKHLPQRSLNRYSQELGRKTSYELLKIYFDPTKAARKLVAKWKLLERYPPKLVEGLLKDRRAPTLTAAQFSKWEAFVQQNLGTVMDGMLTSARRLQALQIGRQKHINSDTVSSAVSALLRTVAGIPKLAAKDLDALAGAKASYAAGADAKAKMIAFRQFVRAYRSFCDLYETYFIKLEGQASAYADTCRTVRNVSAEILATLASGGVTSAVAAAPAVARMGLVARTLLLTATSVAADTVAQAGKRAVTGKAVFAKTGNFNAKGLMEALGNLTNSLNGKSATSQSKDGRAANKKARQPKIGAMSVADGIANRWSPGAQAEVAIGGTVPLVDRFGGSVGLAWVGSLSVTITDSNTCAVHLSGSVSVSGSVGLGVGKLFSLEGEVGGGVSLTADHKNMGTAFTSLWIAATAEIVSIITAQAGAGAVVLAPLIKKNLGLGSTFPIPKDVLIARAAQGTVGGGAAVGGASKGLKAGGGASASYTHHIRALQRGDLKSTSTETSYHVNADVGYQTPMGPVSLSGGFTQQHVSGDLNHDNNGSYRDWSLSLNVPLKHFSNRSTPAERERLLGDLRKNWKDVANVKDRSGPLVNQLAARNLKESAKIQRSLRKRRKLALEKYDKERNKVSNFANLDNRIKAKRFGGLLDREVRRAANQLEQTLLDKEKELIDMVRKQQEAMTKLKATTRVDLTVNLSMYTTDVGGTYRTMYVRTTARLAGTTSGSTFGRGKNKKTKRGGNASDANIAGTINLHETIGTDHVNYVKQRFMRDQVGGVVEVPGKTAPDGGKLYHRTADWERFVRSHRANLIKIFAGIERERTKKPTDAQLDFGRAYWPVGRSHGGGAGFETTLAVLERIFVKELSLRRDTTLTKDVLELRRALDDRKTAAATAIVSRYSKPEKLARLKAVAGGLALPAVVTFIDRAKHTMLHD